MASLYQSGSVVLSILSPRRILSALGSCFGANLDSLTISGSLNPFFIRKIGHCLRIQKTLTSDRHFQDEQSTIKLIQNSTKKQPSVKRRFSRHCPLNPLMEFRLIPKSKRPSALDNANDNSHERNDQQDVNKSTERICGNKTEYPEDN